MLGSFRVGRIAGIDVQIHFSWLIILVLLTGSLATSHFPATVLGLGGSTYLVAGLVASLLLFVSVLAHEYGHALVGRAHGLPVRSSTLFIFGGVSDLVREPVTPGAEFQIAVEGPIVSLVLAGTWWRGLGGWDYPHPHRSQRPARDDPDLRRRGERLARRL